MKKALFNLLTFFLLTSTITFAQEIGKGEWEYKTFPDLPFVIEHIHLDLNINPDVALIQGAGRFEITSRRPGLTQLIFNTSDVDIQEISNLGNELNFVVSTDSLIIQLPDTIAPGSGIEVLILWESTSPYGIHSDVHGNVWTSLNPRARHHWLPIPDHPEVKSTIEASITIPADMEAVFNGKLADDEIISTDEKTMRWISETPVPVSGMSLAVGNFVHEQARSGIKEISVFAAQNALMEEIRSGLLSTAVSTLKNYERTFSFEFPYDALNIIVLPDHHWEEIHAGAGIVYLYQSLGSLPAQLKRGIAEQWLGNYHRYLDAPNPNYEFLKTTATGASRTNRLNNPDALQSVSYWNAWQSGFTILEDEFLKKTIRSSLPELIQKFKGVTSWHEYAAFWYDKTGIFWDEISTPKEEKSQPKERFIYNVEYIYDELEGTLSLAFEAYESAVETLVDVEAVMYGFSDTTRTSFSFTGMRDTIELDISPDIEYLVLRPNTDIELKLVEQKPFMFLIRQLRSPVNEDRIEASRQLQSYTDNPDLQLALQDVLRDEQDPEVRSAILNTLSGITRGASGMEQTFLENLNSENEEIRLSGLRALESYPGNEQVIFAVQNVLLRTGSDTVFNTALQTFGEISSNDEILSLARRLNQSERNETKVLQVLQAVAGSDTTGRAVTMADQLAKGNYPYHIRKKAMDLLLMHEQSSEYWSRSIELLVTDRDPRIRYHALDAVSYLPKSEADALLENREKEEFDPRVRRKLRNLLK